MKYLVNRETKEHEVVDDGFYLYDKDNYCIVQADPEGWIKHDGTECPLPDGCKFSMRLRNGHIFPSCEAFDNASRWAHDNCVSDILFYRPILDDKVDIGASPTLGGKTFAFEGKPLKADPDYDDLLDRLKSAHKAANELPDIIAELREVLGPMGFGIMYLSEFDAACQDLADTGTAFIQGGKRIDPKDVIAEPDMTDWRNWREGDRVECVEGYDPFYKKGGIYKIGRDNDNCFGVLGLMDNVLSKGEFNKPSFVPTMFRFHSRPQERTE